MAIHAHKDRVLGAIAGAALGAPVGIILAKKEMVPLEWIIDKGPIGLALVVAALAWLFALSKDRENRQLATARHEEGQGLLREQLALLPPVRAALEASTVSDKELRAAILVQTEMLSALLKTLSGDQLFPDGKGSRS